MAALLNSLQMGFRSFAIQKRSSEVWRVLGAVKTEFQKFGNVLASSRKRLQQVDDDLRQLIGTARHHAKSPCGGTARRAQVPPWSSARWRMAMRTLGDSVEY
ncbi:MAG: DNA recombination protein RmuC [Eubacteriales bacterium]